MTKSGPKYRTYKNYYNINSSFAQGQISGSVSNPALVVPPIARK